jgi:hypothetical protein
VSLTTVKVAEVVPNFTAVVPVKWLPETFTTVLTGPNVGEKELMTGFWMTVNVPVLVATPPGFVTAMWPFVAPVGTVAVIDVAELTLKDADVPLNVTAVVPPKLVPLIATVEPTRPLVGEKPVTVGAPTYSLAAEFTGPVAENGCVEKWTTELRCTPPAGPRPAAREEPTRSAPATATTTATRPIRAGIPT